MKDEKTIENPFLQMIHHYTRMIRWVSEEIKKGEKTVDVLKMHTAIGETWNSKYCPICKAFGVKGSLSPCSECPITQHGQRCDHYDSYWHKLYFSNTWIEWKENAVIYMNWFTESFRDEILTEMDGLPCSGLKDFLIELIEILEAE